MIDEGLDTNKKILAPAPVWRKDMANIGAELLIDGIHAIVMRRDQWTFGSCNFFMVGCTKWL